MNYFQFYDIPVSFLIDEAELKKKYYSFSRQYHPDFYANEGEEKQAEILSLSTLNNNAFNTLSNPDKRTEYILELNGLIAEGERYKLPQGFLMEMMEVNEGLMELQFEHDESRLLQISAQVEELEKLLENERQVLVKDFVMNPSDEQRHLLLKVKDLYYRKKYLLRIKDSLSKIAPSFS